MVVARNLEMLDKVTTAVRARFSAKDAFPGCNALLDGPVADCVHARGDPERLGSREILMGTLIGVVQRAAVRRTVCLREKRLADGSRAAADRSVEKNVSADIRQSQFLRQLRIRFADLRIPFGLRQVVQCCDLTRVLIAFEADELCVQVQASALEGQ